MTKKTRYKYDNGDYEKMHEMLDINWDSKLDKCNVYEQWCI